MGSKNPGDNWNMVIGVWGTDADRDEVVNKSGRYSLRLEPTAVATKLETGFIVQDEQFGDDLGLYVAEALFTADSAAVGDDIVLKVQCFDINETPTTSTTIHSGPVTAAGVFQYASATFFPGAGDRFAKKEISKASTTFTANIDHFIIRKLPRLVRARLQTSAQPIPDNVFTKVEFNFASAGGIAFDAFGPTPGKGLATIRVGGPHWVTSQLRFLSLVDGQELEIMIVVNGAGTNFLGPQVIVGGAGDHGIAVQKLMFLNGGDTVEIQVRQSGASASKSLKAATVSTAEEFSVFQIARVIGA